MDSARQSHVTEAKREDHVARTTTSGFLRWEVRRGRVSLLSSRWQFTSAARFARTMLLLATSALSYSLPSSAGLALTCPAAAVPCRTSCATLVESATPLTALVLERQSEVLEVLNAVDDPTLIDHTDSESSYDVVSLGLIRKVDVIDDARVVALELEIPVAAASAGAGDRLTERCGEELRAKLDWVRDVDVSISLQAAAAAPPADMSALQSLASTDAVASAESDGGVPGVGAVGHIVAVASCKGGVGKSTTAVNLAYALAASGKRVGCVDLDIHGPSLPTMVTPDSKLELNGESLLPLESNGVKLMSMGFINPGVMPLRGAKVRREKRTRG